MRRFRRSNWLNIKRKASISLDAEVTVSCSGSYCAGKLSGPPEDCYPDEYEDERIIVGIKIGDVELTKEQVDKIAPLIQNDVDEYDFGPEEDSGPEDNERILHRVCHQGWSSHRCPVDAAGDKGRNSARSLSDFGLVESRAFVEELTLRTHRTLQQKAMGVFIQAMVAWAENYNKGSGWYDARNEATVKMSAKIVEMLEKENLIYRGQAVLPLI